jgi:hypothetical protein
LQGEKTEIEIHNFPKKVLKDQKQEFGILVLVVVRGEAGWAEVCWASEI